MLREWLIQQGRRDFSELASNSPVEELELERRTYTCLFRAGIDLLPAGSGALTVGELLRLPGFGVKCLVDLMTSLEAEKTPSRRQERNGRRPSPKRNKASRLNGSDRDEARRRRRAGAAANVDSIPGASAISRSDPRLGRQLRAFAGEASSLGAVVNAFTRGRMDRWSADQLRHFCDELHAMAQLRVETEAVEILSSHQDRRDREIITAYLSQPGRRRPAYRAIGGSFGISGERVRQILTRWQPRPGKPRPFAPALDAALELVAAAAPATAVQIERQLVRQKLMEEQTSLELLEDIAVLLGRDAGFTICGAGRARTVNSTHNSDAIRQLQICAKRLAARFGLVTIGRLMTDEPAARWSSLKPATVRSALGAIEGFRWLNDAEDSFLIEQRRGNGLWARIRKVLSVAPRISAEALLESLKRDPRAPCANLTVRELLDFCSHRRECRAVGRDIIARRREAPSSLLSGVELQMVEFLLEHGPLCRRERLWQFASQAGIGRPSFERSLKSPMISRYDHCVYGLTGARRPASKTTPAGR